MGGRISGGKWKGEIDFLLKYLNFIFFWRLSVCLLVIQKFVVEFFGGPDFKREKWKGQIDFLLKYLNFIFYFLFFWRLSVCLLVIQ